MKQLGLRGFNSLVAYSVGVMGWGQFGAKLDVRKGSRTKWLFVPLNQWRGEEAPRGSGSANVFSEVLVTGRW